jgi:hypothetical protein
MAVSTSIRGKAGSTNKIFLTKDNLWSRAERIRCRTDLAWLLQIDVSVVNRLLENGTFQYARNEDGDPIPDRVDCVECVWAYFKYQEEGKQPIADRAQSLLGKVEQVKFHKATAQVEREMIHNRMLRETLCRLSDVTEVVSEQMEATKESLRQLPLKIIEATKHIEDRDEKIRIAVELTEAAIIACVPV